MNINNTKIEQHIIVLHNIIKMLIDRKFLNESKKNIYFKEIKNRIKSDNITFESDNSEYKINIIFIYEHNSNKKYSINSNQQYIFILKNQKLVKYIKDIKRLPNVELFIYHEFYLNVSEHILVPKFTLLTENQKYELLNNFNCTLDQIPKIFNHDRIIRHYNFPVDSICKIERTNESGTSSYEFRRVIFGHN